MDNQQFAQPVPILVGLGFPRNISSWWEPFAMLNEWRSYGRAGDVTADQGGQNQNVGRGQIAGDQQGRQAAGQANFGNLIAR